MYTYYCQGLKGEVVIVNSEKELKIGDIEWAARISAEKQGVYNSNIVLKTCSRIYTNELKVIFPNIVEVLVQDYPEKIKNSINARRGEKGGVFNEQEAQTSI